MISADVADWIADNVLPRHYVKSCGGLDLIRCCECQYGPCGWCQQLGKHERCTTRFGFPGQGPASPLTHLVLRSGSTRGTLGVWPVGTPCRWRCPCDCPPPVPVKLEARPDVPTQLSLFDLIGGPP